MSAVLTRLYNLSRVMQRLIAIGLLALSILSALAVGLLANSKINSVQNGILEKRELIGKLNRTAGLKDQLLSQASIGEDSNKGFFSGENEEIIRANLQAKINGLADANGLIVSSIANLPLEKVDGLDMIGVGVELSGRLKAIHKTLFAIETSTPPLLTQSALIRSNNRGLQKIATAPTTISLKIELRAILAPNLSSQEGAAQ